MRRWLTLFLLLVLPLQFGWSVAAAYCQHEQSPAQTHIGHHTHEHKAAKTPWDGTDPHGSQDAQPSKLAGDTDCGYCQLSLSKPIFSPSLQFDTDTALTPDTSPGPAFRSRGPDLLDRPNWRIA